MLLATTVS